MDVLACQLHEPSGAHEGEGCHEPSRCKWVSMCGKQEDFSLEGCPVDTLVCQLYKPDGTHEGEGCRKLSRYKWVGTHAAAHREQSESCSLGDGPVGMSMLGMNKGDSECAQRATWAPRLGGLEEGIQAWGCVYALHHGVRL